MLSNLWSEPDTIFVYTGILHVPVDLNLSDPNLMEVLDTKLISMSDGYFDVEYSGRDTNRKIVRLLSRLAALVGTADGEVECDITTESGKRFFEYFWIENGKLIACRGEIVRHSPFEVP